MASSAGSRALWHLVCALAMCQVASAVTSAEVVGAFQEITMLSSKLREEVGKLNIITAIFDGSEVAPGFDNITGKIEGYSAVIGPSNTQKFNDKDAAPVVQVLKTFVQVFQELLNVLNGKRNDLTVSLHREPVRHALVSLAFAEDTFAFRLINLIPTQNSTADDQFTKLEMAIDAAIKVYS